MTIPFYIMKVNPEVEGMDFMGLVDSPAHMKGYETFSSQKKVVKIKDHFNEEKRIVTGVAIAVDLPIYRNDEQLGEHYIVFRKDDTEKTWIKMMKNQYLHNVNNMHDEDQEVEGMVLFEAYRVNKDGGIYPDMFKDQNLKDGSIVVSYKAETDDAWDYVKKNNGFSIEGWFEKVPLEIKGEFHSTHKIVLATISEISKWDIEVLEETIDFGVELHYTWMDEGVAQDGGQISSGEYSLPDGRKIQVDVDGIVVMIDGKTSEELKKVKNKSKNKGMKKPVKVVKKLKPSFFAKVFGKEKLASVTTVDGIEISWEGDLAEGSEITIADGDGEQVLAPEGDHTFENSDGTMTVITVDGNGLVTAIETVEGDDDEEGADEDMAKALKKIIKDNKAALAAQETKHKEALEAQDKRIEKLEEMLKTLCKELDMEEGEEEGKKKFSTDKPKGERGAGKSWQELLRGEDA